MIDNLATDITIFIISCYVCTIRQVGHGSDAAITINVSQVLPVCLKFIKCRKFKIQRSADVLFGKRDNVYSAIQNGNILTVVMRFSSCAVLTTDQPCEMLLMPCVPIWL